MSDTVLSVGVKTVSGVEPLVKAVTAQKQAEAVVKEQATKLPTLSQVEINYITTVLDAVDGNKTKAAQILGITIKTLYNKLHENNLFEKYATNTKKDA